VSEQVLANAGFRVTRRGSKLRGTGVVVDCIALDARDRPWYFDVAGAFTTTRAGLARGDAVWSCLGRAHVVRNKVNAGRADAIPVVLLTSHLPVPGSDGDLALRAAGPGAFFDAMAILSEDARQRLAAYAAGGCTRPLPGFWTERDVEALG
jgi:hypothetical protein